MKGNQAALDKTILESYNLRVLRKYLRVHLPRAGRNGGPSTYKDWQYLIQGAPKYKMIPAIEELSISAESMRLELDELQQKDILRVLKKSVPRRGNGLTDARRRSHQRYHHDVVSPRRKATRHFMASNPELVEEIKRKHGLA